MEQVVEWLKSEIQVLEDWQPTSDYRGGYLDALTNTLDRIQGAQVYLESNGKENK